MSAAILPDGLSLVLCRPTPMVRRVVSLTSLDLLATVRDDPPPQWAATTDRAAVDVNASYLPGNA